MERYLRIECAYTNSVHKLDDNDNVVIKHKDENENEILEILTIDQAINKFYNLPIVNCYGINKAYIWNYTEQKIDRHITNLPDSSKKALKKKYEIEKIQSEIDILQKKLIDIKEENVKNFLKLVSDEKSDWLEKALKRQTEPETKLICYKLFRQLKDGSITSLYINKKRKLPIGEWLEAESFPTKGYALRPFWHCTKTPNAPHIKMDGKVWYRVIIDDYTEFKRPESQGGIWYLAKRMKIIRQIS